MDKKHFPLLKSLKIKESVCMQIYNTPNLPLNIYQRKALSPHPKSLPAGDRDVVSFKGGVPSTQIASTKATRGIEYSMRVIGNKISDLFQPKAGKQITRNIAGIKAEPTRLYLEQLGEIGRLYSTQKVIDVNIEDMILEKLAQKGESVIFVMNHSNQSEDPQMLAVLNTLLSDAYKKAGKDNFPLPKIILNEDILKTMNPTKRKAFENFGAVGIDASVVGGDKGVNARAFLPLVKDFVRNKCNIFIFPEGRLAIRTDLDLFDRFQGGVASLINKILAIKKNVTVVPVGFSYGGKSKGLDGKILGDKNLNGMSIGTPIEIKRVGDTTTITSGDILKKEDSCLFGFFDKHKDKVDVPITSGGEPVKQEEIPDYLKTILCENLEINSNLAKKKLETPLETSGFDMY